jgi:hypothetical protein
MMNGWRREEERKKEVKNKVYKPERIATSSSPFAIHLG